MKYYYYVYKTTNLINGKYYYGVHKSKSADDNYLGSGVLLRKAIEKYGKESFRKEVVKYFETFNEAYDYEKELLTPELIESNECYNLNVGGKGGSCKNHIKNLGKLKNPCSPEAKKKISKSLMGKSYLTEDGRKRLSESAKNNPPKKGVKESEQAKANKRAAFAKSEKHAAHLKHKSPELIEKIRQSRIGKGTGQDNSMAVAENVEKVRQSKIGLKRLTSPDGTTFKMARKNSDKWSQLMSQGYKPST